MSPHLVKCKTFTSDWRQCCVPSNVGDCKEQVVGWHSWLWNDWRKR